MEILTYPVRLRQREWNLVSMPYYDGRSSSPDRPRQHRRDRYGRGSRDASPEYHSRPAKEDPYYSPRYTYSGSSNLSARSADVSTKVKSRPTTPRPPHQPNTHAHRTWPPSPAVEDENVSLAREANPPKIVGTADSDVSCRGSVDQTPIIEDVFPPETTRFDDELDVTSSRSNHIFHNSAKNSSVASFESDVAPDAQQRQSRSRRAELDVEETPVYTRRAPSPYVYKPKTDSGYFSATDAQKTATDKRKESQLPQSDVSSDTLKGKRKLRSSTANTLEVPAQSDISDEGSESAAEIQGPRKPARYSFVKSDLKDSGDLRTSLREVAASSSSLSPMPNKTEPPPRLSELKADYFSDESSNTAANDRHSGSRPSSPNMQGQFSGSTSSPPRSPRPSQIKSDSPRSRRSSRAGSISGSVPSSPIANYSPLRMDEGMRRSSTFPNTADDRSQRTSRLASSTLPSPDERLHPPTFKSYSHKPAPGLPYPEDDVTLMPSEADHILNNPALAAGITAAVGTGAASVAASMGSPAPHAASSRAEKKPRPVSLEINPRPGLPYRHSAEMNLPTLASTSATPTSPHPSAERLPTAAKSPVSIFTKQLYPCPRAKMTKSKEEWYTLEGCSNFDICSTCFDAHFYSGKFRNLFHRAPRRNRSEQVMCDFGQTWVRVAWLMTQRQRRHDLDLVYAVMHAINSSHEHPCSGAHPENRQWYTLLDSQDYPIERFTVCSCDVRKIEALMPSLKGVFVRNPVSGKKRKCDMRIDAPRFKEFIDILVEADDLADLEQKPPDMSRFIEAAQQKAQTRECTRDDLIPDLGWHFAPQLPEFTVCEECYSTVVWPAIADGSSVASRFNKTPLLVHENTFQDAYHRSSGGTVRIPIGSSCQLYSPRMRKIFAKAVQTEDFTHLMRRARERKNMEMKLQAEFAQLIAQEEDLKRTKGLTSSKLDFFRRSKERVSDEWKDWE